MFPTLSECDAPFFANALSIVAIDKKGTTAGMSCHIEGNKQDDVSTDPLGRSHDDSDIADSTDRINQEIPIVDAVAVQVDTVETVQVLAPCDLGPGYHLNVDAVDRPLVVEVPQGGVTQGQSFQGIVISDRSQQETCQPTKEKNNHVPIGAWRDGICDCFKFGKFGLFHPVFCLSVWAAPLLLGQILTRLDLNACAEPKKNKRPRCTAFTSMCCLFGLMVFTSVVLGQIIDSFCYDDDKGVKEPLWLLGVRFSRVGISFFFYIFVFIVALRTRFFVRKKYKIPARWCGEDCCCTLCCYGCSLCQIARHTVDYENGPQASCCSENGLKGEMIV